MFLNIRATYELKNRGSDYHKAEKQTCAFLMKDRATVHDILARKVQPISDEASSPPIGTQITLSSPAGMQPACFTLQTLQDQKLYPNK